MKKKDLLEALCVIVPVVITCVIYILFSTTYTQVPLNQVHLPWATDLHTYLVVEHSIATGLMVIFSGLAILVCWLKAKFKIGTRYEEEKEDKDND